MPVLSLRGYAKHRGVAMSAVQKAIQSGRIATTPDGKINSDAADAEWKANTRPQHRRNPVAASVPARASFSPGAEPGRTESSGAGGLDYSRARAVRENYLARLAKMEYEEKTAKLVSSDEVRVAAFSRARTVRDNLLNIPDRLAATVAAETDAATVHQLLTEEIRKALDELTCDDSN